MNNNMIILIGKFFEIDDGIVKVHSAIDEFDDMYDHVNNMSCDLIKKISVDKITITIVEGILLLYGCEKGDIYKEEFLNFLDENYMDRFVELIGVEINNFKKIEKEKLNEK